MRWKGKTHIKSNSSFGNGSPSKLIFDIDIIIKLNANIKMLRCAQIVLHPSNPIRELRRAYFEKIGVEGDDVESCINSKFMSTSLVRQVTASMQ